MIKLSIIVPVYNVEKYIRPCVESIFKQGLYETDFEVIIVNDGTTDKSMEIISDIIDEHSNITIINQENQGLSVVRNNGISVAKGQYILMPDSDDILIEGSVLPLLKVAIDSKADLVIADFIEIYNNDSIPDYNIQKECLEIEEKTGEELFTEDLSPSHCQVWRALYRRDFLINNQLLFVPRIFFQDIPFTHECYMKAIKCIKTSWLLILYRKNRPGAATASFSYQKSRDYITAIASTWKLKQLEGVSNNMSYKLEENLFYFFYQLIYKTAHSIKNLSERNATIDFLLYSIPNLSFNHNTKQRIISFIVQRWPHLFINVYYYYAKIAYEN